jgi:hypothetical protein
MKTIRYINKPLMVFIIATALMVGGCKKLDEKLYDKVTDENYFTTKNQVLSGYVMPYAFIQTHIYQVHCAVLDFVTHEAVAPVRGGYVDQNGACNRFHQHTWTTSEPWIELEWNNMYQAIGYCNYFIDAIKDKDVSKMDLPVSKEQMVAETKLVRALHYYWLLSSFGNVPIAEHVGEVSPATKSRAEVFAFVEKEIKDNIALLGDKGDANWYGHFTKSAAQALLAKLYLNAEVFTGTARWDDCIAACNAVINSGKFSLDATWDAPFKAHNESSNENIYVVPFDANNAKQFNAVQQQLHWSYAPVAVGLEDAWFKTVTQESFVDMYASNDKRSKQWLNGQMYYTDENGDQQEVTEDGEPLYINKSIEKLFNTDGGYYDGSMNIKYEPEHTTLPDMNNDLVIFRLGDVMFMKAEALMRKAGNTATGEAVSLVNAVRKRAFNSDATGSVYTTGTLSMNELLKERGREFSYEICRREDLIRFNHFNDAWWEKEKSAEFRKLFPIPTNVLTANPNLKQNPGY